MALLKTISLRTHLHDLDWNRHVTSRTYERFGYNARFSLLEDLGYPVPFCLENGIEYVSGSTFVRFLSQQFADSLLTVETEMARDNPGILYFKHHITDSTGKKVCELFATSYLKAPSGEIIILKDIPLLAENWKESQIQKRNQKQNTLKHKINILFSDMSCFWNLPSEAVWKIFEEGRFLFFNEIVDLSFIQETDSTTFFMGGEIQIYELPKPGTKITLHSWIESVEKIRFYFRQDIVSADGAIISSMRDEQLFVTLSTSKPRKAPPEFIKKVKRFIEKR
ncbi:MAG: acyl-[acyl-carrier-protein] thioesterase [Leptospira sp.]|nr:acyl-[acyl-carrier-protein] thioesterase [Leptospira sp.]